MAHTGSSYRTPYAPLAAGDPRGVAKWMLGLVSVILLLLAFVALVLFQISSEGAAKDSLRRASAALTEIDTLLAGRYEELQTRAEASAPGDPVQLDDYPIAIGLTREDVLGVPQADLRATILERSADRLYEDGTSALRESGEAEGSLGLFSVAGFTDRALDMQTSHRHPQFAVLAGVLFVIATALVLATAAACRGWGRAFAPGFMLLVAGMIMGAASLVVRVYTDTQSGDNSDYLRGELFGIMSDHASLALRDGIAFAIAGLLIIAAALIGNTLSTPTTESLPAR